MHGKSSEEMFLDSLDAYEQCYAESCLIVLDLAALCIWLLYTFGHFVEPDYKVCAKCGAKLSTGSSGPTNAGTSNLS
jgi:hypothetical protein